MKFAEFQFYSLAIIASLILLNSGCTATAPKWIEQPWQPAKIVPESPATVGHSSLDAFQEDAPTANTTTPTESTAPDRGNGQFKPAGSTQTTDNGQTFRGQDSGYSAPAIPSSVTQIPVPKLPSQTTIPTSYQESNQSVQQVAYQQQPGTGYPLSGQNANQTLIPNQAVRNFVPSNPQTTYQQPANGGYPLGNQGGVYQGSQVVTQQPPLMPAPQTGAPNTDLPYFQQDAPPMGNTYAAPNFADIDVMAREAQTGRMTFGAAYNSNSGIVGQIIIDEKNFDIWGFPRSWQEIVDGTAWRGRGQGFRMELVPGNEVQRYLVSFTEPYLFNSQVSFSASGYFFDRRYFDWDEQRLGGRLSLGYRLTPDLSLSVGTRMERVNIHDPRVDTSPSINSVLGNSNLFLGQVSLINDTRDHPFMASEGSYLEMSYYQAFGDFSYPRGELDYRRYFLIYQRPDFSGRHTVSLGTRLGFSGGDTPVYENYFAGGFSTLRGFDFRGASPVEGGARVGGRFQWLNTVEYTFPITADDMFKGVLFCDFGTVESDIEINSENFRVAPGFGFRVHMPVGGAGGAPLAFDFAFPVSDADTDDQQVFSFYMGVLR